MDTSTKIEIWLESETLEEILEEVSLTPEEVLVWLWKAGHIDFPPYLEGDLSVFDEVYDE